MPKYIDSTEYRYLSATTLDFNYMKNKLHSKKVQTTTYPTYHRSMNHICSQCEQYRSKVANLSEELNEKEIRLRRSLKYIDDLLQQNATLKQRDEYGLKQNRFYQRSNEINYMNYKENKHFKTEVNVENTKQTQNLKKQNQKLKKDIRQLEQLHSNLKKTKDEAEAKYKMIQKLYKHHTQRPDIKRLQQETAALKSNYDVLLIESSQSKKQAEAKDNTIKQLSLRNKQLQEQINTESVKTSNSIEMLQSRIQQLSSVIELKQRDLQNETELKVKLTDQLEVMIKQFEEFSSQKQVEIKELRIELEHQKQYAEVQSQNMRSQIEIYRQNLAMPVNNTQKILQKQAQISQLVLQNQGLRERLEVLQHRCRQQNKFQEDNLLEEIYKKDLKIYDLEKKLGSKKSIEPITRSWEQIDPL